MKDVIDNLNLPKQVIDKTESLMKTLFGSAANEIGELLADKVRFRRYRNQISILEKTVKILESKNLKPRELNLKTLVPLIENISMEEDENLQDKWANLISNIASTPETGLEPKLIKTLSNLSSLEAQVLDYIYWKFINARKNKFEYYQEQKYSFYKSLEEIPFDILIISFNDIKKKFNLNKELGKICIDNLEALGLIRYEQPEIEIDNGSPEAELKDDYNEGQRVDVKLDVSASYYQSDDFYITTYGNYFVKQCKD